MSRRTWATNESRRWLPVAPLYLIVVFLVVMPVGVLIYASLVQQLPRPGTGLQTLTLENYRTLWSTGNLEAVGNSLSLAVGGTILALAYGFTLAFLAARTDVPMKPLVQLAGVTALFMSSLVGALAWSFLASPRTGYLNLILDALGIHATINIYSIGGMVFVSGLYYAPYAFLLSYGALTLINPDLENAALVHGATRARATLNTTFPLVAPAAMGSALLIFVLIIENFPIPQILGTPGNVSTLPSFIFRLMNLAPPQGNLAAAVGVVLMLLMSVVIVMQRRFIARREYSTVSGKGFRPELIRLGKWRWPAFLFAITYLALSVLLPFGALLQAALRRHGFLASAADLFDASAFSLHNFESVVTSSSFQTGVRNTLLIGLLTAVIGAGLHLWMSYTVYRTRAPGRQVLEYVAMAPLAIPSLVLGMGFLWTWVILPIPIFGTVWVLILAFTTRYMPQGYRGMTSSIMQVHRELEESAHVSGASKPRAVMDILLPLIRSGTVSTMLLLFLLSARELSAAIFLFTSDTRVLSIVIFDQWDGGGLGRAAATSILFSFALLIIVLASKRWLDVGRPTSDVDAPAGAAEAATR